MEPPAEPPDGAEADALDGYLVSVYDALRAKEAFAGDGERMTWVWRLHQLRRRQHEAPALWEGSPDRLLVAIDQEISRIPVGEPSSDVHMARGSEADYEDTRLSIPMMESETTAASDASSWATLSRLIRRASGALTGSTPRTPRDSGVMLASNSGALSSHEEDQFSDFDIEEGHGGEAFAAAATASSRDLQTLDGGDQSEPMSMLATVEKAPESGSSGGGLRQSVPSLLRSFVSYLGLSMEETFLCQICFEFAPLSTSVALSNCQHTFCRACLQNYLEFKISEAQVYPLCFYQPKGEEDTPACAAEISVDDIRSIVSEEAWVKYTKFKFNKENERARQCPFCDHSQLCAGPDDPACECEECGREFCFLHSNAHEGRSCAEYEKKMLAIEKLNHALISEISKPCPGCQNHVEKTGGCNQMKCVVCNTSFCWICLQVIDDNVFPEHFQWWNIRGCAGNQMADVEQQTTTQKIVQGILRFGFFVVFGPPALALAIVFCVLCCFFTPCTANGRMTFRHAFTTCFCVSGYALLAPFVLAAGLAMLGLVLGGAAAAACVMLALSPFICLAMLIKFDSFQSWSDRRQQRAAPEHRA